MDCTNKNCPAYAKCLAPYRGSRCKATRATYGLGDPMTNADKLRAMTDEELAEFLTPVKCVDCHLLDCGVGEIGDNRTCEQRIRDWLKQEVSTNG